MVSPSTLKRLSDDLAKLEERHAPKKPWRVVHLHCGASSDRDAIWRRHVELYPEDDDPSCIFWIIYEDDLTSELDTRENAAWHQIMRETGSAQVAEAGADRPWRKMCIIPMR